MVGRWLAASLAIAMLLLVTVWIIAKASTPDSSRSFLGGLDSPDLQQVLRVLMRNSLVLALHAFACVAGFIAGSSLPREAERYSGTWRWIHEKAGPLAILFVVAATSFSLITQAYVLGGGASTLAAQFDVPVWKLLLALLPHALPELLALFLPLAAWMIASRRGEWHKLLAATFVTVAISFPVLVVSAAIEVFFSPQLLLDLQS